MREGRKDRLSRAGGPGSGGQPGHPYLNSPQTSPSAAFSRPLFLPSSFLESQCHSHLLCAVFLAFLYPD